MSFLSTVGNVFKKIFGFATNAAVIASPFVIAAFPEIGNIYTSAIGLALKAETLNPQGSGPQKLAQLTADLVPQVQAWAKANGIVWNDAEISKWASALVDTLNLIPAPSTDAKS